MILPNNIPDAKEAINAEIVQAIENLPGAGLVWGRIRYADNMAEWRKVAAVVTTGNKEVLRCAFVYEQSFRGERIESGNVLITVPYAIEVIHQFLDGTDEENSTKDFNRFCGIIQDRFLHPDSLGFTDAASQFVNNTVPDGGDSDGRPALVDGLLSHRRIITFDVSFRRCKGKGT